MKIVMCGSMAERRFYEQMQVIAQQLQAMGHEVLLPIDEPEDSRAIDAPDTKAFYLRTHFDKITKSDGILVFNPEKKGIPGYIGGATLCEMAVAFASQRPIFIVNPLPSQSQLSYMAEIACMDPVVLNGDLSQLKAAA